MNDEDLELEMQQRLANDDCHDRELTNMIPDSCFRYNSNNLACGKQGSGKSYRIMQELIKISYDPYSHLMVYVPKSNNMDDRTVENLKPMLGVDVVRILIDELPDFLDELLKCKKCYNSIIERHLEDQVDLDDPKMQHVLDILHVRDFSRPSLQTLIFIDDVAAAAAVMKPSKLVSLMTENRHGGLLFCLAVQYWSKAVSPQLKTVLSSIMLFGGFADQIVNQAIHQIPFAIDNNKFKEIYRSLETSDCLFIDTMTGKVAERKRVNLLEDS